MQEILKGFEAKFSKNRGDNKPMNVSLESKTNQNSK
jgi:hypothetical protein